MIGALNAISLWVGILLVLAFCVLLGYVLYRMGITGSV